MSPCVSLDGELRGHCNRHRVQVKLFEVLASDVAYKSQYRCQSETFREIKNTQQCDPPNTYPLARRVLGRFAPGTRRASGPVPVIADVRSDQNEYSQKDPPGPDLHIGGCSGCLRVSRTKGAVP